MKRVKIFTVLMVLALLLPAFSTQTALAGTQPMTLQPWQENLPL
jgi:hypothetical protein